MFSFELHSLDLVTCIAIVVAFRRLGLLLLDFVDRLVQKLLRVVAVRRSFRGECVVSRLEINQLVKEVEELAARLVLDRGEVTRQYSHQKDQRVVFSLIHATGKNRHAALEVDSHLLFV